MVLVANRPLQIDGKLREVGFRVPELANSEAHILMVHLKSGNIVDVDEETANKLEKEAIERQRYTNQRYVEKQKKKKEVKMEAARKEVEALEVQLKQAKDVLAAIEKEFKEIVVTEDKHLLPRDDIEKGSVAVKGNATPPNSSKKQKNKKEKSLDDDLDI